jgi:hypothetical protein
MSNFSQRYGYVPLEKVFQRESVDEALRTKLWNVLKVIIWDKYDHSNPQLRNVSTRIDLMLKRLWFNFYNKDLDTLPEFNSRHGKKGAYDQLKEHFLTCEWFGVYSFIEEISHDQSKLLDDDSRKWINSVLEEQNAAYRFVSKEIVEVTDEHEIKAIEDGLDHPEKPVRTHLEAACEC